MGWFRIEIPQFEMAVHHADILVRVAGARPLHVWPRAFGGNGGWQHDLMTRWELRRAVNYLNVSTPAGLLIARCGRARTQPGPRGLVHAHGYRLRLPKAAAFTVGNVVITRHGPDFLGSRPALAAHEERHCSQYAALMGLPFLPAYLLASLWSLVRGGDVSTYNVFECRAGLQAGGYPMVSARARRRGRRGRRPGRAGRT